MISESIAKRYVKALFEVARDKGEEECVRRDLNDLQSLYHKYDEVRQALTNPQLPDARKEALLVALCGEGVAELTRRFVALVIRKRRVEVLTMAGRLFGEMLDEQQGVRHAYATSALPLTEEQRQRVEDTLARVLSAKIVLVSRVDVNAIGGLSVQVGDLLMDGTIRRRLNDLERQFARAREVRARAGSAG